MKILSSEDLRRADAYTIQHTSITSIDLMERAATIWTAQFMEDFPDTGRKIYVLCGPGNNGGDGLVIARLLSQQGFEVEVWIPAISATQSEEFAHNFGRLPKRQGIVVRELSATTDFPGLSPRHCVIDALFGSGLSRPISGIGGALIRYINKNSRLTVAVDMPSGLFADKPPEGPVMQCRATYTFQSPKLSLLLDAFYRYYGRWKVLDIGLDKGFIDSIPVHHFMLDLPLIQSLHQQRSDISHKGTFGHAHIVAGSYGKMGAALLCAKACLRSGVGLVTAHVPRCGVIPLQTALPEVMLAPDKHEFCITQLATGTSTCAIGPGLGTNDLTQSALASFLNQAQHPLVLDADALNIIAMQTGLIDEIPERSILTPHPKEFKRLFGSADNPFEVLELQREASIRHSIYIVYKSHFTRVTTPEGMVYFNSTGNDGMATAGSGDVLTGVISGLLVQGYSPLVAAMTGIYIHGLAGDIAADQLGHNALIAGDIIEHLGFAFKVLEA